jgi:Ca2+-binding EF-hand superfamily protein
MGAMTETADELRGKFDEFDIDGDGAISEAEFTTLVAALGVGFDAGRVYTAFMAIDVDGNGRIEFGEFRAWWKKQRV